LRLLIEAALEEGLLRYSRRQMIVERARELGLSEFQAHLLIAQVQYGETEANASAWAAGRGAPRDRVRPRRRWARVAGVGLFGAALYLILVRLVG